MATRLFNIIHFLGRSDSPNDKTVPPNGRLPDATQGQDHIRQIFYRMGFNDREIVALSGAHTLGRCHKDRSGFTGRTMLLIHSFSLDLYSDTLFQSIFCSIENSSMGEKGGV